jgi:hypothetical protein
MKEPMSDKVFFPLLLLGFVLFLCGPLFLLWVFEL